LRRQVLKRCIYGVDLDPMAVELAKMTLWLRCSTPGAPLPFLDHHLRCGNALIGTRVEEVERELELPGQRSVRRAGERAQLVLAARLMRRIGELPDLTASQVRESRAELRRATETVASAKVLLDLFTSRWFGNEPRRVGRGQGARIDDSAMEFLRGEEANRWLRAGCGAALLAGTDRELVERGLAVAADRRFFHWEIEFPDAFCGPREETSQALGQLEGAGFDAVIGNPPWGATMGPALRAWCRERFPSIGRGETDHFAAFLDVALRLTRHGGRVGLLLPDILLLKNYPHARHRLLTQLQLSDLVHWGQPFAAVNLDVCSVVGQRVTAPDPQQPVRCIVDVADWGRGEYATNLIEQGRFLTNKEFRFNLYLHPGLQGCLDRIRRRSHPLGEFLEFHEGIHSGNMRSKLFVDEDDGRACRRLILRGDEVSPFRIGWAGKWVRYDRAIVDRAAGEYANLGHVHYFTSPKLLVRRTGDRLLAAFDDAQFFASNNFFVALVRGGTGVPLCGLEALLNARLATWFFRAIQPRTGRLFAEVKITHLEDLPVPQALTASDWAWLESQARDIRSLLMAGEQSAPEEVARLRSQIDRCLLDALGISWGDLKRALPVGCSWALPRRSPYGAPADKIR
jgi:hypothetical protein